MRFKAVLSLFIVPMFLHSCKDTERVDCSNLEMSKIINFSPVNPKDFDVSNALNIYSGKSNIYLQGKKKQIDWNFYTDESHQIGLSIPKNWKIINDDKRVFAAYFGELNTSSLSILMYSKDSLKLDLNGYSNLLIETLSEDDNFDPELYEVNASEDISRNFLQYKLINRIDSSEYDIIIADFCDQIFDVTLKIKNDDLFENHEAFFLLIANSIRVKKHELLKMDFLSKETDITIGVK